MKKTLTLVCCLAAAIASWGQRERIILLNEGNWQADNGRVTYFQDGEVVSNQWFRDINNQKLGDTPNDILQINDSLIAMAINWSNIVQFIRPDGHAVAATEDVPNNRKLATDGRYAYISSYGHECGTYGTDKYWTFERGYVAKIDIATFQLADAVEVGYEPEGIACYKGHLFVANTGGYAFQEAHDYETTVSVIDAATMRVVRTVDTGQINLYGKMSQAGPYLCINSPGDYYNIQACTIILDCDRVLEGKPDKECFVQLPYAATYNTTTREGHFLAVGSRYSYITSEYTFNYITINPTLVMESHGSEGVEASLPGTMLEDIRKMSMPYGIYVNPYTGYMYATDAGSFASAGGLHQWDAEGNYIGQWKVYINPAHFLALPPTGTTDGILRLKANHTGNGLWHDLYGRTTRPRKPGLYIHNGKIFTIK